MTCGAVLFLSSRAYSRILLISSNRNVVRAWYGVILLVFIFFIFLPTTFVLIFVFDRFSAINEFVLKNPERMFIIFRAIFLSFAVSFMVTAVDLLFGLPLAWVLARRDFKGKELVNTLIESPLAIPTAGLGFSVALFWAVTPSVKNVPFGALKLFQGDVYIMIVLFHLTTTFPYVVRSLTEILEELDVTYEIAGLTCGASNFTVARTISLPMFRSGIATAAVLAMAKSLSDTGGVVTLLTTMKGNPLTDSDFIQATALIDVWKGISRHSSNPSIASQYEAALALVSFLMILFSLIIIFLMRYLIKSTRSPVKKVFPSFERRISQKIFVNFRNAMASSFITLFIFIPSFFVLTYLPSTTLASVDFIRFVQSVLRSFFVGFLATALNVIIGLPLAIFVTRKKSKISQLIDSLIDVPYLVPSAALGISASLYWSTPLTQWLPDIFLVVLAHMSMTFPFIARNAIGGLEELDVSIEETARTLGARPLQVFTEVTLPSIKGAVLAGAVMGFTRSVGETGATLAVADVETAPVFIVNAVKNQNYGSAAITTLVLTALSYVFILIAKTILNWEQVSKNIQRLRSYLQGHPS